MPLLNETPRGLYCERGDFYIDPWQPVDRAVVTHAHSDHAREGSRHYLAASSGKHIFRMRLPEAKFQFEDYGTTTSINEVKVSLHPSGHMTGAAMVRLEYRGEVAVVSGDYKLQPDPTCPAFEPLKCHTFVTESTFGLPIYRWPSPESVFADINRWWRDNQENGRSSILFTYAVGKSQRLLSGIDADIGPIFGHGAILKANAAYEKCGVNLPQVGNILEQNKAFDWTQALVVAPPSARGSTWLRRFGNVSMAMASGWMRVRGVRRRQVVDRGFVLSDHADWPGLLSAIEASEAQSVWATHGFTQPLTKYLNDQGQDAREVKTEFGNDIENGEVVN